MLLMQSRRKTSKKHRRSASPDREERSSRSAFAGVQPTWLPQGVGDFAEMVRKMTLDVIELRLLSDDE